MPVWMAMPSAAPLGQAKLCVSAWKTRGYRVAIAAEDQRTLGADWAMQQAEYPGYASSVNRMVHMILANDPACQIIVAAGDDMFPDQKRTANEIAEEFIEHFDGTLGVSQPCGDPWALDGGSVPQARRVAGSPWLGREFCRRANMGQGPLWPEFFHCWADNFLAETAERDGLMWWNEHVTHRHEHFLRRGSAPPPHAAKAYSRYNDDQATFERLKAKGFPGSGLLPE